MACMETSVLLKYLPLFNFIHLQTWIWLILINPTLNMKVYFKQGWGIGFTIAGLILFCGNLWLISVGQNRGIHLVVCSILTFSGIMYLVQPYFELRSNELVLFSRVGMEVKRYPFNSYADFDVVDGKVYINTGGQRKKVRVGKMMAKNHEWERFIGIITGDDLTREIHNI
jgi:hypothetical protein